MSASYLFPNLPTQYIDALGLAYAGGAIGGLMSNNKPKELSEIFMAAINMASSMYFAPDLSDSPLLGTVLKTPVTILQKIKWYIIPTFAAQGMMGSDINFGQIAAKLFAIAVAGHAVAMIVMKKDYAYFALLGTFVLSTANAKKLLPETFGKRFETLLGILFSAKLILNSKTPSQVINQCLATALVIYIKMYPPIPPENS